jgi:hypothetical protein
MSKFLDSEGYFDEVGQKPIGTSSPTVINGEQARALWLLLADQKQTDLIFWGPSFCVIGGEEGQQFGEVGSSQSGFFSVWVPGFCDRLAFEIIAKGVGDVTIGSSYTISVSNQSTVPILVKGSQTSNLVSVTGTGAGNPVFQKIAIAKDAGVDLRSVIVRFLRSAQEIS